MIKSFLKTKNHKTQSQLFFITYARIIITVQRFVSPIGTLLMNYLPLSDWVDFIVGPIYFQVECKTVYYIVLNSFVTKHFLFA